MGQRADQPESPAATSRVRRHWGRDREVHTVLLQLGSEEYLGKTQDFSAAGMGVVVEGARPQVGDSVEVAVVVGWAVHLFRGAVCHVCTRGSRTRVGIRFIEPSSRSLLGLLGDQTAGTRAQTVEDGCPPMPPPPHRPSEKPVRTNIGVHFDLLSHRDRQRMLRDTEKVADLLKSNDEDPLVDWARALRRFLKAHPTDPQRAMVERELFRLAMQTSYPSFPGTVIRGRVYRQGHPKDDRLGGPCLVVLDLFSVAKTDPAGNFVAEGLPVLDEPATLSLGVRQPASRRPPRVDLRIPPRIAGDFWVELPVELAPHSVPLVDAIDKLLHV